MSSDDEMKKRLEALERENRALKEAMNLGAQAGKTIYCSIGDYKGHPMISFEGGGGRPFSIGLKKAAVVLASLDHIRDFVAEHGVLLDGYTIIRRREGDTIATNADDDTLI